MDAKLHTPRISENRNSNIDEQVHNINMQLSPPISKSSKFKNNASVLWGQTRTINNGIMGTDNKSKNLRQLPHILSPRQHSYNVSEGLQIPTRLPTFDEIVADQREPQDQNDLMVVMRGTATALTSEIILPEKAPPICIVTRRVPIELKIPAFGLHNARKDNSANEPQMIQRMPYFAMYKRFQTDERISFESMIPNICFLFLMFEHCPEGDDCKFCHTLPSSSEMEAKLSVMKTSKIKQLYQVFVRRNDRLLRTYFCIFARLFGQRTQLSQLLEMLSICENRDMQMGSADNYEEVFRSLRNCVTSYADVLVNIIFNFPDLTHTFVNLLYHKSLGLRIKKSEFDIMMRIIMDEPNYIFTPSILNVLLPIADKVQDVDICNMWIAIVNKNKMMGTELKFNSLDSSAKEICRKIVTQVLPDEIRR